MRSLCTFLLLLYVAAALSVRNEPGQSPFSCTGGSVYFSAHPIDSLLFQNPDLLHDLYVFKCTTTVVLTSGNRGNRGNYSRSLERGLEEAYALMAGVVDESIDQEKSIWIGKYPVESWLLNGMPNMQIVYLRLPDSTPSGAGYDANHGESLTKLYTKEIKSVTRLGDDGRNVQYTLADVKDLIGVVLRQRQPNNIRILNHKASIPDKHSAILDHADHVVSAKLVKEVADLQAMTSKVQSYAGNYVRHLDANIKTESSHFIRKAAAFFRYAERDDHMCQSYDECTHVLDEKNDEKDVDEDAKYVAQYLGREYYVS